MNIRIQQQALTAIVADLVVVPVAQGEQNGDDVKSLDSLLNGALKAQVERVNFVGKEGEMLLFHTHTRLASPVVLLYGAGKIKGSERETWRRAGGKVQKEARSQGAKQVAWFVTEKSQDVATLAAVDEGALLSSYVFDRYKSEKNGKLAVETLTFVGPYLQKSSTLSNALDAVQKTAPGVFLARDLINEPASVSTPSYLAEHAARIARTGKLTSDIFGPGKMKTAKMAGLLAVAQGSAEEPRFIKLIYKPNGKPKKKIALVKGLTFDSGGPR
jgi:leucyl aminopeptidase